jgi:lipid IVA palmitoyltransferase
VRILLGAMLWLLLTASNAYAWECKDWGEWFNDRCVGTKEAWKEGDWSLYVPFYTWHAPYAYPNRDQENAYPLGGGIGRSVDTGRSTDMLFGMIFQDSHYKPMYVAGYGYLYNWGERSSFHTGAGFAAVIWARSDSNYIPYPGIAPIASVSYSRVSVMGTYLPFIDVAMFWARVQF